MCLSGMNIKANTPGKNMLWTKKQLHLCGLYRFDASIEINSPSTRQGFTICLHIYSTEKV